jgi:DNA-binding MarR family transcriptional regulator
MLNHQNPLTISPPSDQLTEALHAWAEVFMRRSMRDFTLFLRQASLSMPQASALFRLHYGGRCAISDIAGHLGVTNAAASQMVDRFVQQGLVERVEHPNDRRVRLISLSSHGRALIEQGIEARRRWMDALPCHITPDQQQTIITALRQLASAAHELDGERVPGQD